MNDLLIFGFGLAVTLLVGSALTTLIVIKNRLKEESHPDRYGAIPVHDEA